MASKDGVITRHILSRGVAGQVTGSDTSVAIRLKSLLANGGVTSVTVTTGTNIVLITANGGTDTYAFATYATVGALTDAINADGMFEVKVLDTLRSKPTATQFVDGVITLSSLGYYDVMVDTSAALYMAIRLTYDRNCGVNYKLRDGHRVNLQEIVTSLTLGGGADVNALSITECAPIQRGNIETTLLVKTPTTGSPATINWASGQGKITANEGNDIVVMVTDGTSFGATDTLAITGIVE